MAENQLFPVFDLPEIPDNPEYDERYYPSVYFDFETGDFLRDGAGRMITSAGREAYAVVPESCQHGAAELPGIQ